MHVCVCVCRRQELDRQRDESGWWKDYLKQLKIMNDADGAGIKHKIRPLLTEGYSTIMRKYEERMDDEHSDEDGGGSEGEGEGEGAYRKIDEGRGINASDRVDDAMRASSKDRTHRGRARKNKQGNKNTNTNTHTRKGNSAQYRKAVKLHHSRKYMRKYNRDWNWNRNFKKYKEGGREEGKLKGQGFFDDFDVYAYPNRRHFPAIFDSYQVHLLCLCTWVCV